MTVCPICKGRGTVGYYHIDHFVDIECDRCNGSGEVSEVEMTNEEYLRSCNTEQLADVITDIVWECKEQDDCMDCKLDWCIKDYVVEWLKQPHTVKE